MQMDEDLLYDDLYEYSREGKNVPKTSLQELEEQLDLLRNRDVETQASLKDASKQIEILRSSKDVLLRNISCLFKTAQLEVARKDKLIKELREEVAKLQSHKTGCSSWTAKDGSRHRKERTPRREGRADSRSKPETVKREANNEHRQVTVSANSPEINFISSPNRAAAKSPEWHSERSAIMHRKRHNFISSPNRAAKSPERGAIMHRKRHRVNPPRERSLSTGRRRDDQGRNQR